MELPAEVAAFTEAGAKMEAQSWLEGTTYAGQMAQNSTDVREQHYSSTLLVISCCVSHKSGE